MNSKKVADALNTISVAFGELAEALIEQPESGRSASAATRPSSVVTEPSRAEVSAAPADLPPSFDELPPEHEWRGADSTWVEAAVPDVAASRRPETPQGALAQCPKHHVLYKTGKYGKYCPSISDDPSWRNDKGFCRITPKNAAAWLAETAA